MKKISKFKRVVRPTYKNYLEETNKLTKIQKVVRPTYLNCLRETIKNLYIKRILEKRSKVRKIVSTTHTNDEI